MWKIIGIVLGISTLASQTVKAEIVSLDCQNDELKNPAILQSAPHGAQRTDPHTLQVHWEHGSHIFADVPPFDEPLDGTRYHYCSYSPSTKMHLIAKEDGDLFTGVLLHDATGKILEAGLAVIFSPDASMYFTIRQPNGLDGEEWIIYTIEGQLLWKGLSGILDEQGTSFIAFLEQPVWTAGNQLQATHICVETSGSEQEKKVPVTLDPHQNNPSWNPLTPRP